MSPSGILNIRVSGFAGNSPLRDFEGLSSCLDCLIEKGLVQGMGPAAGDPQPVPLPLAFAENAVIVQTGEDDTPFIVETLHV